MDDLDLDSDDDHLIRRSYSAPDPNDGRFDDIDDEDPMANAGESSEGKSEKATSQSRAKQYPGTSKSYSFDSSQLEEKVINIKIPTISEDMFHEFFSKENTRVMMKPKSYSLGPQQPSGDEEEGQSSERHTFPSSLFSFFSGSLFKGESEVKEKKFTSESSTEKEAEKKDEKPKIFAYEKIPGTYRDPPTEKFKQPEKVEEVTTSYMASFPDRYWSGLRYGTDGLGMYGRGYHKKVARMDPNTPKPEGHTRFVCISDTHNSHRELPVPRGDVLLHCGDFTDVGEVEQVDDFNAWLGELPHKYKIVIAGNHELSFDPTIMEKVKIAKEQDSYIRFGKYLKPIPEEIWRNWRARLPNCVFIEDQEVRINGIRIYGSPWQPEFGGWAYNLKRGKEILEKWNKIPGDGIDILMTHGPPVGHGDGVVGSGDHVGCVDLLNTIQLRVQPKYHLFGHIHESYGVSTDQFTVYANCSNVNYHYDIANRPFVFDLPNVPEAEEFVGPISY